MTGIEREYAYDHKWGVLVFYAGTWTLLAALFGYHARNPWPDNVVFGISCGMSVVMIAKMVYLLAARWCVRHRLALTPTSLLVPKADWSSEELTIDYQAITGLKLRDYGRFLDVRHPGGKYRISVQVAEQGGVPRGVRMVDGPGRASRHRDSAEPDAPADGGGM
jgi:hypothetical protein